MSAGPPAPPERPLWLTVPGASAAVALGWVPWLALAALAPSLLGGYLGSAGAMLAVVTVGWFLARSAPEPSEALRRYHLDAAEVTAMGPGTAVRRLPWSEVVTLTEARHALVLEGRGTRLPLPPAAVCVWAASSCPGRTPRCGARRAGSWSERVAARACSCRPGSPTSGRPCR